jgi:hypothetical protein
MTCKRKQQGAGVALEDHQHLRPQDVCLCTFKSLKYNVMLYACQHTLQKP